MKTYALALAASQEYELGVEGVFVNLVVGSWAAPGGSFLLINLDDKGYDLQISPFQRFTVGKPFKKIKFKNPAGNGAFTGQVNLGYGQSSQDIAIVGGTVQAQITGPNPLPVQEVGNSSITPLADISIANGASAQIAAISAVPRRLYISTFDGASGFRIGDAGVGAAKGIFLPQNVILELRTQAAVHAWNLDAGANKTITVTQEQ